MTAPAFEKPVMHHGQPAAADYSAKQYFAMKYGASTSSLCSVIGERVDGVLQNEPTAGQACKIMTHGFTKVSCGGTVAVGDPVMTDAAGEFIKCTVGNYYAGFMTQAGVDGDVKTMKICPGFLSAVVYQFFIDMTLIADGDLVTTFTPGFAGAIEKTFWVQENPVTTASKASTLNFEIGTTNLTGGVISLTSAACTPLGAVVAGTAVTANNTFGRTDTISVEASSTTTFIEGSGTIFIQCSHRPA